jgi:hypothetical protein
VLAWQVATAVGFGGHDNYWRNDVISSARKPDGVYPTPWGSVADLEKEIANLTKAIAAAGPLESRG